MAQHLKAAPKGSGNSCNSLAESKPLLNLARIWSPHLQHTSDAPRQWPSGSWQRTI